jgi:hypothetical protein
MSNSAEDDREEQVTPDMEEKTHSVLDEWLRRDQKTQQRRTMGRSARRRRAKLKAIQEAEERLWSDDLEIVPRVVPVPKDRACVLTGVLASRSSDLWTDADEAALVAQLGFVPGNAVAVVARAGKFPSLPLKPDAPIILKLYPLVRRDSHAGGKRDGRQFKGRRRVKQDESKEQKVSQTVEDTLIEPFPTMYWLTDPLLKTLVSKLEIGTTHNCRVMEERLSAQGDDAIESMARAHAAYGQERWNTLTPTDVQWVVSRNWKPALDSTRGVSGIKKPIAVKCLHAHLAHYLSGGPGSTDNIVGKWTFEAILELISEHNDAT